MDLACAPRSLRARRAVAALIVGLGLVAATCDARAEEAARSVPRVVKVAGSPNETALEKPTEGPGEPERSPVLVRPFLLIPDGLSDGFGDFVDVSGWNQASITLGAGNAYDWNIAQHFFLSMLGNLGLGASRFNLSFASSETERSRALAVSAGLQLAASFVTKEFHLGLVAGGAVDSVTAHRVDVAGERVSSTLFGGVRF